MSQLAREELAEILFQEIASYLPTIQRGITDLYLDGENAATLHEVHRLFHNIKGAASQVSFVALSRTAAMCEAVSSALLVQKTSHVAFLDFLASTTALIDEFCRLSTKNPELEELLFKETATVFVALYGDDGQILNHELSDTLRDAIWQAAGIKFNAESASAGTSASNTDSLKKKCMVSFQSVLPLISQFTRYLSQVDTKSLTSDTLSPLADAVETLADYARTAELQGHHRLLSDFQALLSRLLADPALLNPEVLELLREFVAYLEIVFSMEPEQGEKVIDRVQNTLSNLVTTLLAEGDEAHGFDAATPADFPGEQERDFSPQQDNLFGFDATAEQLTDFAEFQATSLTKEPDFADTNELFVQEDELFLTPAAADAGPKSEEDELREIFQAECEEHLLVISRELNMLETSVRGQMEFTPDLRENVSNLRRAVHTLKGAAAMTGFDILAGCAHGLEDLLDWLNDNATTITGDDILVIAKAVDTIETLSDDPSADPAAAANITSSVSNHLAERNAASQETQAAPSQANVNTDAALFEFAAADFADQLDAEIEALFSTDSLELEFEPDLFQQDALLQDETLTPFDETETDGDLTTFSDAAGEAMPDSTTELFTSAEDQLQTQELFEPAPAPKSEDDELLEIFQAECEEHLQAISRELNMLETSVRGQMEYTPSLRENVSSMRRAVHTLKGAAAMTGFDVLSGCAHGLEDLLDWLNDQAATISSEDISVIARAVDVIETLSSNPSADPAEVASVSTSVKNHLAARADKSPSKTPAAEPQAAATADIAVPEDIANTVEQPEAQQDNLLTVADTELEEQADVTGNIRVRLGDLDELTSIEGELVVARGSLEKQLESFSQSLSSLHNVKELLQRKSQELEVGFEAQSLYGFGPSGNPLMLEGDEVMHTANPEFDPIELDQYSQLNLIIRSLNEISSDMNELHSQMITTFAGMRGQVAKQQLAMGVMQEKLLRIRMTPFSSITRLLFRTVRQTAAELNKDVRLSITGEDVYMDRFVWSKVLDPLMHILRNCVDHGIEVDRAAAGKTPTAQISIDALQRSRNVVLRISDDGRGVDIVSLRRKLLSDGLIEEDSKLTDDELLPYLFRPSISTKKDISAISGRGVGLDVVLKNIKELRGTVQMFSRPGQGVTFELAIPITLSVNRAIVIDVSGTTYAIALQDVVEAKKYPAAEVQAGTVPTVLWRDQTIKVYQLASLLSAAPQKSPGNAGMRLMLIVDNGTEHVALEADRVIEQREIIIKNLGSHLKYVRGISGVTLTGEGTIIPILNPIELAKDELSEETTLVTKTAEVKKKRTSSVLVIDDSISVRHAITRLLKANSWETTQAVDGVDALEKLEGFTPDVIIVDIEMPRMNGYEFMSVLQSNEKRRAIPVVMLTSRASEKHRKKAFDLGVQHYVTKPYQEEPFLEMLESLKSAN